MDWENSLAVESAISETEISSSNSDGDADDEQSDLNDLQLANAIQQNEQNQTPVDPKTQLEDQVIRRIEKFITNTEEKELILTQIYHSSLVFRKLRIGAS